MSSCGLMIPTQDPSPQATPTLRRQQAPEMGYRNTSYSPRIAREAESCSSTDDPWFMGRCGRHGCPRSPTDEAGLDSGPDCGRPGPAPAGPGPTAGGTVRLRAHESLAAAGTPLSAAWFLANWTLRGLKPVILGLLIRARYAEQAVEAAFRDGIRQYVIVGAGLDSFALRRTESSRPSRDSRSIVARCRR